jgi:hypothetical protein
MEVGVPDVGLTGPLKLVVALVGCRVEEFLRGSESVGVVIEDMFRWLVGSVLRR